MIKYKKIKVEKEEKVINKAFCSFCKKEFDKITTSSHGFGQINISFGYGSSFDDDSFNLEICDNCFIEKYFDLLKEQLKEKGFNIDKLKEVKKDV